MPGFGAAEATGGRKRYRAARAALRPGAPHDVGGGAARTARLREPWLIGNGKLAGSWLRKYRLGSFDIWKCNLKTNATDKVRDLPVEADEVLVFEKTEDASGFNDGAGDYGFGEIAITANGDQLSELFDGFSATVGTTKSRLRVANSAERAERASGSRECQSATRLCSSSSDMER